MNGARRPSGSAASGAVPAERAGGAVAKVVRILEALTEHAGVTEISRKTGLPTSTVHRIIHELIALGWVRGDGEHGYLFGVGLLSLVGRAESEAGITSVITPILNDLRDATSHTVHFALRQGDQAVYLAKIEGRRAYAMRSRVGLAISLHCTGIGKALLSALPETEVREILDRAGMPARTARTVTDPDTLLGQLRLIARRGYALDDEENEEHTRCIAAPVHNHSGRPIGGISMSAMAFEIDQKHIREYAHRVREAAGAISRALGSRGPV